MRNNKYYSVFVLAVILSVSAFLRLYRISEYMTFLGDEGRDVLVVKHMIVDHVFTLLGPTASVGGFFLGPIYYYFMLPFLWLWKLDPVGPAVMVALFGIATTYLVFRVGKDFFEPLVGYIAASLYAVSPVIIASSRSSWNPNLVPFFSLLLVYFLWKVSFLPRRWDFFWIGITLGIGLQLHYLFLFLFCLTGLWYLIHRRVMGLFPSAAYTFLGFVIAYSPFILFELRHGFPNTQALVRFFQEGKDTGFSLATFFQNITDVTFRSFARLLFRFPTSHVWDRLPGMTKVAWESAIISTIILSMLALISKLVKLFHLHDVLRQPAYLQKRNAALLVFLWLLLPIFLFGFYKRAIYDYYLGIFYPVPFLLVGLLLVKLFRTRLLAFAASLIWVILLYFNWAGRPYIFPPNNQLGQVKKISAAALDMTGGRPFNFALITGFNSDHAYRYFFEIWGNKPVTIENATLDPERKTVTEQLIVICELDDCQPLGNSLWEVAGFGRAQIDSETYVPFVKIYKLSHYKGQG